MNSTEQEQNKVTIPVAEERPRRFRPLIRSTCRPQTTDGLKGATSNIQHPTSNIHPPASAYGAASRPPSDLDGGPWVLVRMIGLQEVPLSEVKAMGAVWSPSAQRFEVKLFKVVGGNSTLTLDSTFTEATLLQSGIRIEHQVDCGELTEQVDFPEFSMAFELALNAAWDMAEQGDFNLTITALEQALHLARVEATEQAASPEGIKI